MAGNIVVSLLEEGGELTVADEGGTEVVEDGTPKDANGVAWETTEEAPEGAPYKITTSQHCVGINKRTMTHLEHSLSLSAHR
jgi:hypothetical protein